MYSPDGQAFSFIADRKKQPQIFRGPVEGNKPIKQIFDAPIEAQIIRINPQTWHSKIALKVELVGCKQPSMTIVSSSTSLPLCVDPMGVDEGLMADHQITVSSELNQQHGKAYLKTTAKFAWQPVTNSPSEWVQFDFLGPRILSGLVTKGGSHGWVITFNVKYSHDGKEWNTVLDEKGNEQIFIGNVDENTAQITEFRPEIKARFLKIIPHRWHRNIQLRIEPYGCFVPYPQLEYTTMEIPSECNNCPNIATPELGVCRCKENLWWDGDNCVERPECPCMIGHIPYNVGAIFENKDCAQCVCKIGGVSHCTPKICPKCEKDLRSVVTSTCGCICQPCEEGTRLCPTSNICINNKDWCNGVKDCPDDESDCEIITVTPAATTTETPAIITGVHPGRVRQHCSPPTCASGYKVVFRKNPTKSGWNRKTMFTTYSKKDGMKTASTKGKTTGADTIPSKVITHQNNASKNEECLAYDCISTKPPPPFIGRTEEPCPEVFCPDGYVLEIETSAEKQTGACVTYECKEPPSIDAVCNVTGRTFNTFDNTEYKYDVCNHILIRDLNNKQWEVSLKKNCSVVCSRDLIIQHEDHTFVFYPDLSIKYDGYTYTIEHTKKIGFDSNLFAISQLGEALVFVSNKYGFWVIWNKEGNAKIGVSRKLLEQVDGLCGFFNEESKDDKRKPDGSLAKSTSSFGDSWTQPDQPVICEAKTCPVHIQNKAWEMCNLVKERIFAPCARAIDLDAFLSRCLETTCTCLEAAADDHEVKEKCRCSTLQRFVVDCLTADSNLDVIDWRMKYECPAVCEAPLVHYDCYRRRCEPSCGSLNSDVCPKLDHVCFPGCYCPAGYVRKGEDCILPIICGDCECNVLPHLQYVTYDGNNVTIDGNCTYIMSQNILQDNSVDHKFQVLVTNEPCIDKKSKMCVGKVTVVYKEHKLDVIRNIAHRRLKLLLNSKHVNLHDVDGWARVTEDSRKHFRILLHHEIQIHISVYYPSLGVSIKAPSFKYGGKLEGLCGNCDGNPNDDLRTSKKETTSNLNELGRSWLYGHFGPGECVNQPEEICKEVQSELDPCLQLGHAAKFEQCNPVLSPNMFIEWCKKDTCNSQPEFSCAAIEAYALECGHLGFCIDWRKDLCPAKHCPAGQEYKPCAPVCSHTCETVKEVENKCTNPPIEGCFCPEGKVFLNDTCVTEERCEACDDEGHRSGDVWLKNVCTTCRCEGTNIKCETQKCPVVETVCEEGFNIQKVSVADECCDKYTCVQMPTTSPNIECEASKPPSCNEGQIKKVIQKADGCQQFVCECKPRDECDEVDVLDVIPSEPGMVVEIDESGCCPVSKQKCKINLCPRVPTCPQFHIIKNTTIAGACCPSYICEQPKDSCIVDFNYISSEKGGERLRHQTENEKYTTIKKVGDKWQDGPCRQCECVTSSTGENHGSCTRTNCPTITNSIDHQDYLLEEELVIDECCPRIKKVACKYNGEVYKVGSKWQLEDGYCTTAECVENSSGIQKLTYVATCDSKCELGWEYIPATIESKTCCGSCKPIGCVVDGVVYKNGEEWKSLDYCTNYNCSNLNGSMQIQSVVVNCPESSEDLLQDYVVEVASIKGECCKKQKKVACRVGHRQYRVGDTWPSPDGNKCKKITCTKNKFGEIIKEELSETCSKNCSLGWEYKESDTKCCGECIQTACVVGNELKYLGENWTSADGCVINSCTFMSDQFMVIAEQESCPNIENCPAENIYIAGCCKHCNVTAKAQVTCGIEELNLNATIGVVSAVRPLHGKCVNKKGLNGFTECVGTCKSHTKFNSETGQHDSICTCCQVEHYKRYAVELECQDGYRFEKHIAIPSECSCKVCTSEQENVFHGSVEAQ